MRRAILAVAGMVAGTTLLISLKSAPGASRLPEQVAADLAAAARAAAIASASPGATGSPSPGPAGVGPSAGTGGQSPAATRPGQQPPGQQQAGAPQAGQPVPGATTKAPSGAPATTTKPPATAGSFTGDSSYTEFGYVTVVITVSGGKVTEATMKPPRGEWPENEPRSKTLSANADKLLGQRVLAAQSARIDSVSGATYTSAGYKTSLQSALDKAGMG